MIEPARTPMSRQHSQHGDPKARAWSRRWVPIVVILLLLVSVGNVLIGLNRPTIPDEIEGLIVYPDLTPRSVEGAVEYSIIPPAGGEHAPASLECGIYRVPVEDEQAVAALATGAVWFAYDPEIGEGERSRLTDFAEGEIDTFMSPYPGMPADIVVTAWGVQLYPDGPDDVRIGSFLRDYKNGEQAPYPDLACRADQQVPPGN